MYLVPDLTNQGERGLAIQKHWCKRKYPQYQSVTFTQDMSISVTFKQVSRYSVQSTFHRKYWGFSSYHHGAMRAGYWEWTNITVYRWVWYKFSDVWIFRAHSYPGGFSQGEKCYNWTGCLMTSQYRALSWSTIQAVFVNTLKCISCLMNKQAPTRDCHYPGLHSTAATN